MLGRHRFVAKAGFVGLALLSAAIGAHSLNPRELYSEMYPLEPVKQDAFHICDETDPTFVRAVGSEREACYNKMPHIMAVAMGRIKSGGALSMQALTDPSRETELLMVLASMPPQQPITTRRSFANTTWVRELSSPCTEKAALPVVAYIGPAALPPPPGSGRAATLDSAISKNLPPLPKPAQAVAPQAGQLPVIPLGAAQPVTATGGAGNSGTIAAFSPLPAPDIGDSVAPVIVPLAPAGKTCGGV